MLEFAVVFVVLAAGIGATVYSMHQLRLRRLAHERLALPTAIPVEESRPSVSRALRRFRWIPWLLALLLALLLGFLVRLPPIFAATFGMIAGLMGAQFEVFLSERKVVLLETQLADAIDLMVAALHAGASVSAALETAMGESRNPLRQELEDVVGRIRYGDAPRDVFQSLSERVPLESFRLFSSTLAVHAEVGGSLARTLSSVGRIVRDRLEIGRKIRSMTTQARVSIWAVLGTTYFIGLIIWRNNTERMADFLGTSIGQTFVAAAMLLQALGILWSARISRMRY